MIKLYGFALSNYYNIIKFALLEKGAEFEELMATPSQEDDYKNISPMGKIPCIETDQGYLSETSAIREYLEAVHPNPALMPTDAFAAAKVREIMNILELYIELPARRLFGEVLFGEERNEAAFTEARPVIENGLKALKNLGSFDPYICGEFSHADILVAYTFIFAAPVCQAIYDWDILAEVPGLKETQEAVHAREAGVKVLADHQVALKSFMQSKG